MLAFLSYARDDWKDAAAIATLEAIIDTLEARVRSALGEKDFTIWRDVDQIRWSDVWRAKLKEVLADCDLFIALYSPLWVGSEICREEDAAFLDREKALAGARIFPAMVGPIADDACAATDREIVAALNTRQWRDWSDLVDLPAEDRSRELRAASAAMAEAIRELRKSSPAPSLHPATPAATVPVSVDAQDGVLPLVSGCYLVPKGQRQADAESVQVLRSLAFAGRAKVETSHGSVVFTTRAATLMNRVIGPGAIVGARAEFEPGWRGPVATVRPAAAGAKVKGCWLEATDDAGLRGNLLAGPADGSHAPLLDVGGTQAPQLSGVVVVEVEAVAIEGPACDPPQDLAARDGMAKALARLVLERCGGTRFAIEEDPE